MNGSANNPKVPLQTAGHPVTLEYVTFRESMVKALKWHGDSFPSDRFNGILKSGF